MIFLNRRTKVFAHAGAVDLRKSFDSLFALVRDALNRDPLSGHVFLFVNRVRSSCKALYWDGTGLVLICKRLEKGVFTQFNEAHGHIEMTESEFGLFFEGADLNRRFIESPAEYFSKKEVAEGSRV
jgi:transposase